MSPTSIVAYLTLFTVTGFSFVFASLLLGRFLRPKSPSAVKLETYECGEPAVGSSYVQFDLRFYVVALLFIIFDVEMAFFFPWATVFGKATQLMDPNLPVVVESKANSDPTGVAAGANSDTAGPAAGATAARRLAPAATPARVKLSAAAEEKFRELGVAEPTVPFPHEGLADNQRQVREEARQLALTAMVDIGLFFAVLLVGFAYVWYRGDLDWVRAVTPEPAEARRADFRPPEQTEVRSATLLTPNS